jgi:ethanolamine utilization protein EutN
MLLGRVVGVAIATRKVSSLAGARLLVVQPLDRHRRPRGRPAIAVDVAEAGPGDLVYLVRSREAALAFPEKFNPADLAIVGVVDSLSLREGLSFDLPAGTTHFT